MSSIDNILFPNPVQPGKTERQQATTVTRKATETSFAQVLDAQLPGLKFSNHAQERLRARNINLTDTDLQKLNGAVENVARKGGKESLVMLGDAALVVSIKNRTVVTALDRTQMMGNVFTNIDSAVIL